MIDIIQKTHEWRAKAAKGELTREEMREAVIMLRGDRKMSVEVGAIKKKAATKVQTLLEQFANEMKPEGK